MANLIGYVQGDRGSAHRVGSKIIDSRLQTWEGRVYTWLDNKGEVKVQISGNITLLEVVRDPWCKAKIKIIK